MLHLLVADRSARLFTAQDREAADQCLAAEARLLRDARHVENEVVGPAAFEWDHSALQPGFVDLVEPSMARPSATGALFLRVTRELGCARPEQVKAVLLLEYAYWAALINDAYTFQAEFTKLEPDLQVCASLTQQRYAAQYLTHYPRYLLVNNVFKVDDLVQAALHQWVSNVCITLGVSRGVFVKWAHSGFQGMTAERYYQNAINSLCSYFLFPVILGALFAGVQGAELRRLKQALSWLTLAAKIGCERRWLSGALQAPSTAAEAGSLLFLTFPGQVLCQSGAVPVAPMGPGQRFPGIPQVCDRLTASARQTLTVAQTQGMLRLEETAVGRFVAEMATLGLLARLTDDLAQGLAKQS